MIWLLVIWLSALPAHAERGLLTHDPQQVLAGERVQVELETPHGLTPPPGIQNERSLRGFAARLCSKRAPCVPLAAENVRPRDGWSMVYRAEFAVPRELAAGPYDLDVRFPGGRDQLAGGVIVRAAPPETHAPPAATHVDANGCSVAFGHPRDAPLGLLLLAVSWKLAAGRRRARTRARE